MLYYEKILLYQDWRDHGTLEPLERGQNASHTFGGRVAHGPVFAVTLPDGASPRSLTAQALMAYLHLSTLQCTWSGADCFPLQDP